MVEGEEVSPSQPHDTRHETLRMTPAFRVVGIKRRREAAPLIFSLGGVIHSLSVKAPRVVG